MSKIKIIIDKKYYNIQNSIINVCDIQYSKNHTINIIKIISTRRDFIKCYREIKLFF